MKLVELVTRKSRSRRAKRRKHAYKRVAARLSAFYEAAQTGEETT